jgi:hypothetical protein
MRTNVKNKNRRRTPLEVEPLEGKALLSAGALAHHVAHHDVASAFTGTLSGHYNSINAPFFANIQNYVTSGTLTSVGSAHLYGTLFVRGTKAGRFDGQLFVRNQGGGMILKVYQSGTANTYSYRVAHAGGSDSGFRGDTGTILVSQNQTFRVPYYSSGTATVTLS